jgi:ABC-type amino acid transport substrate-binding protein
MEHKLQIYIKENYQRISRMEQQLTYENCEILVDKYDKGLIIKTLEDMENYKQLNKKYVSVYRTIRNWMDRANDNPKSQVKFEYLSFEEALSYLNKSQIPYSRITDIFEITDQVSSGGKKLWKKR